MSPRLRRERPWTRNGQDRWILQGLLLWLVRQMNWWGLVVWSTIYIHITTLEWALYHKAKHLVQLLNVALWRALHWIVISSLFPRLEACRLQLLTKHMGLFALTRVESFRQRKSREKWDWFDLIKTCRWHLQKLVWFFRSESSPALCLITPEDDHCTICLIFYSFPCSSF